MNIQQIIEPTFTTNESGESVITHPAFGVIKACRITGTKNLFKSDAANGNYVEITISNAEVIRSGSREWLNDTTNQIKICISEHQWLSFISGVGFGLSTPCTIAGIEGQKIAAIPAPESPTKLYKEDIEKVLQDALKKISNVASQLNASLNATAAASLQHELQLIGAHLQSNTHHFANSFNQHVERTVNAAEISLNAHIENIMSLSGQSKTKSLETTGSIKQAFENN